MEQINATGLSLDGLDALNSVENSLGDTDAGAVTRDKSKGALKKAGAQIYRTLTTEQKQSLNANSGKFQFICLLGAQSAPKKKADGGEQVEQYGVVGMKIKALMDIDLPVIPFVKPPHDVKASNKPNLEQCAKRHISAGEIFVVNRIEALVLFTMPEYGINGYIGAERNGEFQADGVQLTAKTSAAFAQGGLPTPAFKFTDCNGSIKDNMEFVDVSTPNGFELKPEYAELFKDLLTVRVGGKGGVSDGLSASAAAQSTLTSLAIWDILKG